MKIKVGHGIDIHQLKSGESFYLGGVKIESDIGIAGHSDGDIVIHAIVDAILGALSKGDIGTFFPNNEAKFKNIRSTILLSKIIDEVEKKGYLINNIDINIITQKPKIQKYKKQITNS